MPVFVRFSEWNVRQLTGPAESEVVGYYRHTEVCSLTGTLRACGEEPGKCEKQTINTGLYDNIPQINLMLNTKWLQ